MKDARFVHLPQLILTRMHFFASSTLVKNKDARLVHPPLSFLPGMQFFASSTLIKNKDARVVHSPQSFLPGMQFFASSTSHGTNYIINTNSFFLYMHQIGA